MTVAVVVEEEQVEDFDHLGTVAEENLDRLETVAEEDSDHLEMVVDLDIVDPVNDAVKDFGQRNYLDDETNC